MYDDDGTNTGHRSCNASTGGRDGCVSTVQLSTLSPPGGFQHFQRAAYAKGRLSERVMKYGSGLPLIRFHSKKPSIGTRARRLRKASRNAGLVATVSMRALKRGARTSCAQGGMSPHRIRDRERYPASSRRKTAMGCVGARLKQGKWGTTKSREKSDTSSSEGVTWATRPHMGQLSHTFVGTR